MHVVNNGMFEVPVTHKHNSFNSQKQETLESGGTTNFVGLEDGHRHRKVLSNPRDIDSAMLWLWFVKTLEV